MAYTLVRIFYFNVKLSIARAMQYRANFFINLFIAIGFSSVAPVIQYLIFTKTRGYPGWTLDQILLFQGCLLLWAGLKDTLFGEIRIKMNQFIQKGNLDILLLKPCATIGAILTNGFNLASVGAIVAGLVIIGYAAHKLALNITPLQIMFLIVVYIFALILYLGVLVLFCSVNILIVFIGRLGDVLDKLIRFSEYPVEIFPHMGRLMIVAVIPVSVWVYFPAQVLLNRFELSSLIYPLLSCLMIFFGSLWLWSFSIKKYASAGG